MEVARDSLSSFRASPGQRLLLTRSMAMLQLVSVLSVAVTVSSCNRSPRAEQLTTLNGPTMGTRYTIKLVGLPPGESAQSLSKEIDARLRLINQQMSTYIDDSEISRFNRAPAGVWFDISRATAFVVQAAQATSEPSTGHSFTRPVTTAERGQNFQGSQTTRRSPTCSSCRRAGSRHRYGTNATSCRGMSPRLAAVFTACRDSRTIPLPAVQRRSDEVSSRIPRSRIVTMAAGRGRPPGW